MVSELKCTPPKEKEDTRKVDASTSDTASSDGQQVADTKSQIKGYFFAWVTSILLGSANFVIAFISYLDIKSMYPQWFISFLLWILFHAYKALKLKREGK